MHSLVNITVGARASNLSKVQVKEVFEELKKFYPSVSFSSIYLETKGDLDQKTSLRSLGKCDFFTREVDQMLLQGRCRIAIHSAKDLPEPLPFGLELIAVTKGVDASDSLVMPPKRSLKTLKKGAVVATSSERRENAVKQMRDDFQFMDLRGTIEKRISLMTEGKCDAVVIAEAALIRLNLNHLNRINIPGKTVPGQGRLAIVARSGDDEMKKLFAPMHYENIE